MNPTIPWWTPRIAGTEGQQLQEVLASNYLNEGKFATRFEADVARHLGVAHAIATTSGTAALFLALSALGIGPGDEVIVPDITFIATANAVSLTGAKPILADVGPETLCLCPKDARKRITERTRAVIPVHLSGRPGNVSAIAELARSHKLSMIEDAAEAFGSNVDGRSLGTIGQVGCFSLSPNKTITTGQGGIVVTNDAEVATRVRMLKDQGRPTRGTGSDDLHPAIGYNFKFTNLQAAVGLAQLEDLENRLARQRQIRKWYGEFLDEIPQVRLLPFQLDVGETPLWTDATVERRDELDAFLKSRDIHCRRFWHPLHRQAPYHDSNEAFPVACEAASRAIWLPSAFHLTATDIQRVANCIKEFYRA